MRNTTKLLAASLFCSVTLLAGCRTAMVGTGTYVEIPPDAATTCESHCASIGLRLSAVAIMAENVGCVCQASQGADGATSQTTPLTAGMATIAMQNAEEQRQQQQQQQAAK